MFYEALYNFVVRIAVSAFSPAYTALVATELNRLFRSSLFNAAPPEAPPAVSDDPFETAKRLHSWRVAKEDASFMTLKQKIDAAASGGPRNPSRIDRDWARGVPVRKALNMRSPLVAAFLPTREERIRASEQRTRAIKAAEAAAAARAAAIKAARAKRRARKKKKRKKRKRAQKRRGGGASFVKASSSAATLSTTGLTSRSSSNPHPSSHGGSSSSSSSSSASSLSCSNSLSSASLSSSFSSYSTLCSRSLSSRNSGRSKDPDRELTEAWYDGLYSEEELGARLSVVNDHAAETLAAEIETLTVKLQRQSHQSSSPAPPPPGGRRIYKGTSSSPSNPNSLRTGGSSQLVLPSLQTRKPHDGEPGAPSQPTSTANAGSIELDLVSALREAREKRTAALHSGAPVDQIAHLYDL